MAISHTVESELLQPIPRRIQKRSRKTSMAGIGCMRVFILPHSVVGVGALCVALWMTAMALFGSVVPGTVWSRTAKADSDGGTVYRLQYKYNVGGQTFDGNSQVNSDEYAYHVEGAPLQVKIFPPIPDLWPQLARAGRTRNIFFTWFFALFWNGVLSIFWWTAWVVPAINKNLVRRGTPVAGRISHKEADTSGESDTYTLHYEWVPAFDSAPAATAQTVSSDSNSAWSSSSFSSRVARFDATPIQSTPVFGDTLQNPLSPPNAELQRKLMAVRIGGKTLGEHLLRNPDALGSPVVRKVLERAGISPEEMQHLLHDENLAISLTPLPPLPGGVGGKMAVAKDEWNAAAQGDNVTILHDPRNPKRSLIYKYADPQAVL